MKYHEQSMHDFSRDEDNDLVWVTRDKRRIKVKEMTDDHLRHAVAYLERKIDAYPPHRCCVFDMMDGPCFECEDEDEAVTTWRWWIDEFNEELNRRKS